MIDLNEREEWFQAFRDASFKLVRGRVARQKAIAWASSMSLVAEQFVDNDNEELEPTE